MVWVRGVCRTFGPKNGIDDRVDGNEGARIPRIGDFLERMSHTRLGSESFWNLIVTCDTLEARRLAGQLSNVQANQRMSMPLCIPPRTPRPAEGLGAGSVRPHCARRCPEGNRCGGGRLVQCALYDGKRQPLLRLGSRANPAFVALAKKITIRGSRLGLYHIYRGAWLAWEHPTQTKGHGNVEKRSMICYDGNAFYKASFARRDSSESVPHDKGARPLQRVPGELVAAHHVHRADEMRRSQGDQPCAQDQEDGPEWGGGDINKLFKAVVCPPTRPKRMLAPGDKWALDRTFLRIVPTTPLTFSSDLVPSNL